MSDDYSMRPRPTLLTLEQRAEAAIKSACRANLHYGIALGLPAGFLLGIVAAIFTMEVIR